MFHATSYFKEQPKLTIYFSLVENEEWASTELERFYNVDSLKGPPRRFGGFRAPARGDLIRELTNLLGPFRRRDRVSPSGLKGKRILCEVETVVTDRDRRALSRDQQYSRIKRLIKTLPDEDW